MWSRLYSTCNNFNGLYTSEDIKMRRKAEVLKHNKSDNLNKKQQWSKLSQQYKRSIPSGITGINENNENSENNEDSNMICNHVNIKMNRSGASDVPGNSILYYDKHVPYIEINKRNIWNLAIS